MGVAVTVLPQVNQGVALLYYTIVGMGWVLPAMPIVRWMQRPDPDHKPVFRLYATLTRRKQFQTAVAAPDVSTRT